LCELNQRYFPIGAPGTAPPRRLVKISGLNPNANGFGYANGFGGPMSSPPPANGLAMNGLAPPPYGTLHGFAQAQMAAYLYHHGYGGIENGGFGSGPASVAAAASTFAIKQAMINLSIQQQQ
jgi:hypothetical protein